MRGVHNAAPAATWVRGRRCARGGIPIRKELSLCYTDMDRALATVTCTARHLPAQTLGHGNSVNQITIQSAPPGSDHPLGLRAWAAVCAGPECCSTASAYVVTPDPCWQCCSFRCLCSTCSTCSKARRPAPSARTSPSVPPQLLQQASCV